MNAKSFSRFTIVAMVLALVLALGTANAAKTVPGSDEKASVHHEQGSAMTGRDADNHARGHSDADVAVRLAPEDYGQLMSME